VAKKEGKLKNLGSIMISAFLDYLYKNKDYE